MLVKKTLTTLAEGENVVRVVKRHPIGLMSIYLFVVVGSLVSTFVISSLSGVGEFNATILSTGAWGVVLILILLFILIAGFIGRQVYWSNELIITDENLIQIIRPSLLRRDVVHLNLSKVQDASVIQKGFLPLTFRYGTVIIETAGESPSYEFRYAPNPNEIAASIIEAHDEYIKKQQITTPSPT